MANRNKRRAARVAGRTTETSADTLVPRQIRSEGSTRASVVTRWDDAVDTRRVLIFILFAFGIAWAAALYLYLTGGLLDRPADDTLFGLPTALVVLAVVYMGAPTFANLLTRLVTRESWDNLWIAPNFRHGWRYWALAWVLPGLLTIAGGVLFFLIFPQYYDRDFEGFQAMLAAASPEGEQPPLSPMLLILLGAVQGILLSPLINGPATFGEEFGWRAYLLQKLMPLGWRRAAILMGIIWGIWHWPVIAMGHNYGLEYPGAPWIGMLVFVWFTFTTGTILGWLTLRARSVWPAVIGHAAINGIAALGMLVTIGEPNPVLGPLPVGIIGMLGYTAVAIWMFFREP